MVSVEHASARVPKEFDDLGLPESWFDTHHAFDPGAPAVGRMLSRALSAPLFLGRYTRLLVDLNRSSFHPRVLPRTTGSHRITVNEGLSRTARRARLDRYWLPYRTEVGDALDAAGRDGAALHISVHSFTPALGDDLRNNDVGLMYDPARVRERALADRLHARLADAGYRVRRNYPYSGKDDGFCMRMRQERATRRYTGMQIEMNQGTANTPAQVRAMGRALVAAFEEECE